MSYWAECITLKRQWFQFGNQLGSAYDYYATWVADRMIVPADWVGNVTIYSN